MKLHLFILCTFLCSCSWIESPKPSLERPKLNLSYSKEIQLNEVKFKVLTENNSKEYFKTNKAAFALTEQQYKNLSLNIEEIKHYMRMQLKIINSYKDYYEENLEVDAEK